MTPNPRRAISASAPGALHAAPTLAPEPLEPLDRVLVAEYDPASSAAWAGAAPELWAGPSSQFDLWETAEEAISATEEREGDRFRAEGFSVRPIAGRGAARILDEFCSRVHRTLRGRGMNGRGFGLFDPGGHLVGAANFAPPSNPRTAAGMQVQAPGDADLSPAARAQVSYAQRELTDCVRLCVAEESPSGTPLGTGAESFFYAACLRTFVAENRALWRAIRMAELGFPLPPWASRLLARRTPFTRVVRSFAESGAGQLGTPYMAVGAWYLGPTREEMRWVGRRSGEAITRRSLAKLHGAGRGHLHQTLRAVWEGSDGRAVAFDFHSGLEIGSHGLDELRRRVPDGLTPAERQHALSAAWRALADRLAATHPGPVTWEVQADTDGYEPRADAPKHRYATFLSARPHFMMEMVRRCKYLRADVLRAEAAWYAEERRWPRGLGFNWPRPRAPLGRPPYPRRSMLDALRAGSGVS